MKSKHPAKDPLVIGLVVIGLGLAAFFPHPPHLYVGAAMVVVALIVAIQG